MVVQKFTSEELAKFKAADPDDVVSVWVNQAVELMEQNEQLSREYARVSADKVRLEEELAEYKSNSIFRIFTPNWGNFADFRSVRP